MELLIFIGAIVILVFVFNLRGRVQKLEQLLESRTAQQVPEPTDRSPQQFEAQQPTASSQPSTPPGVTPEQTSPTSFDKFVEWIKGQVVQ